MPITFVAASSQYITMASEFAALRTTSSFCFWLATTQQGNDLPYQAPCVAGIEQDQGEQDIFWGWLDYNSGSSRLGISKGNTLGANSGTINDGTLRHFCFTWNSSDGASQCFVDGALSSSGTADSGDVSLTFADLCRLLDQYAVARSYVDGTLDDVRIYNYGLNAEEIHALYQGVRIENPLPVDGKTGVVPGSVLRWLASPSAGGHDVYIGNEYEHVAAAGPASYGGAG